MAKTINWFRRFSWYDGLLSIAPMVFFALLATWLSYHYIDPAPSRRMVITTGAEDSEYLAFANSYRAELARDGVTLTIQSSGGALDNLRKLRDQQDEAQIAFLQDGLAGTVPSVDPDSDAAVLSLGSISYQPIWIFYRGKKVRTRLSELTGKRIAIGQDGSAINVFANRLLTISGVTANNSKLVAVDGPTTVTQLEKGEVDAAFFIGAPDSDLIKKLSATPYVHIMNLDQAEAYSRHFPYLHALVLPHGSIDLERNVPAQNLHLLATTTTVAVTSHLHPALVSLLMRAMQSTHEVPDLLNARKEFPAAKDIDFPLSKDAERFYKSGSPFLQRYLPFWLATLLDRAALAIIPILAVLIPVLRTAPSIFAWRTRRRIYRWYGELKFAETQAGPDLSSEARLELLRSINQIEDKVTHAAMPLVFSEHVYVLKEHIDFVRRKLAGPTA